MARDLVREGVRHHQAGRLREAKRCYQHVPLADPAWPHAAHYLGLIAHQSGEFTAAVALISSAIARQPDVPEFHVNLGNAQRRLGQTTDAMASFERALALRPDFSAALANKGLAEADAGLPTAALASLQRALAVNPALSSLRLPVARLFFATGDFAKALEFFAGSLGIGDPADAWVEAGNAALEMRRADTAVTFYHGALAIDSQHYHALNGLGVALASQGQISTAIEAFRKAVSSLPDRVPAIENLANTLKDAGLLDEAIATYRQAMAIGAPSPALWSNFLFSSLYSDGVPEAEILFAHQEFDQALCAPATSVVSCSRTNERKIRVGYLSGDFFEHPVARFIEGVFAAHDKQKFELFAYQSGGYADAVTERLKRQVGAWRTVDRLDDQALAEVVLADQLDVLVELSGHTANNRLVAISRRLAPVQLSYLGYPFGTGVSRIDGRIVDQVTDPVTEINDQSLIRLPRCYYAFTPAPETPLPLPLPMLGKGRITFGVASNLAKVSATTLDDWAALLRAIPGSVLRWRAKAFSDAAVRQRMFDALAVRGVISDRVRLEAWVALKDRWIALSEVDIALDTRPYNQATSTCESLWMGVPTLTLIGQSHRARMGASILGAIGLTECIGSSVSDWIALVTAWQKNPERLAALRSDLRQRMLGSALCDSAGLARLLEAEYEAACRKLNSFR